jgi:hypothetical protein
MTERVAAKPASNGPLALLLFIHVFLLVHAATSFSLWTDAPFSIETFQFIWRTGFSLHEPYVSPYTLPLVLTYLAAHAIGFVAYVTLWNRGWHVAAALGYVLCALAFATFGYEATHWLSTGPRVSYSYNSLIVSAPAISIPLAIGLIVALLAGHAPRAAGDLRQADTPTSVSTPSP